MAWERDAREKTHGEKRRDETLEVAQSDEYVAHNSRFGLSLGAPDVFVVPLVCRLAMD